MSNLSPQPKDYAKDLADSGIEVAAKNLSDQVDDNADIIQTKTAGLSPTLDNALVRFDGTDGLTVHGSSVVIDDSDNFVFPDNGSLLIYPQTLTYYGPPTFTNRSIGSRIIFYTSISSSSTDVAIGIDANTMWFSHIDSSSTRAFKWYGGTTEAMRLQGNGELLIKAGGTGGFAKVGGVIFDHFTDVNNSGTAETDLYSDTIPANALNNNGDKLTASYQLVCTGAVGASQEMRLYFGGTLIYDSGALSMGAITSNFTFEILIIRVSASVVRCAVSVSSDFATLFPYSKYTEVTGLTLTNNQILKITGTAAGAAGASNQLTAKLGTINWIPQV